VALDPGSLVFHEQIDWRDSDGNPTDLPLKTVDVVAEQWAKPTAEPDVGEIVVDPRLTRRVGRGGALIDAPLANSTARAADHQVLYTEGDAIGFVGDDNGPPRPAEFARRYQVSPRTARGIAAGRRPGPVSIRQVLHVVDIGDQLEQRVLLDKRSAREQTERHPLLGNLGRDGQEGSTEKALTKTRLETESAGRR
jgi:hypothetical protein